MNVNTHIFKRRHSLNRKTEKRHEPSLRIQFRDLKKGRGSISEPAYALSVTSTLQLQFQQKNFPVKQSLIFQGLPVNGDAVKSAKLADLLPLKLWAKVGRGIDKTRLTFRLSVHPESSVHINSKAYLRRRLRLTKGSSQTKTNFRPRSGQKFEF